MPETFNQLLKEFKLPSFKVNYQSHNLQAIEKDYRYSPYLSGLWAIGTKTSSTMESRSGITATLNRIL